MSSIKLEGLPQLIKAFREFGKKLLNKGLARMFRAGAKVMQREIKALMPVGETKLLRKALKVRSAKRKKDRVGMTVVHGAADFQGPTFYGPFLNWGTKNKDGETKIKARNYVDIGFKNGKESASRAMLETLKVEFDKAAAEARKAA